VFLLWSRARPREREILADIASRFDLLSVIELAWTRRHFSENLTRFYGQKLPSGSQKQRHCGTGAFLVVVVRDTAPEYAHGVGREATVNVNTWEARERYRAWTGGGHRVHASLDASEADHDLYLLLGLRAGDVGRDRWSGTVERRERDLLGSTGWADVAELFTALTVTLPWLVVGGSADVVPEPIAPTGGVRTLELLSSDGWWAAATILGRRVDDATRDVLVGGERVRVVVHTPTSVGDEHEALSVLARRVPAGDAFVPDTADATRVADWLAEGRTPGAGRGRRLRAWLQRS
jgi:hypothetical protein